MTSARQSSSRTTYVIKIIKGNCKSNILKYVIGKNWNEEGIHHTTNTALVTIKT